MNSFTVKKYTSYFTALWICFAGLGCSSQDDKPKASNFSVDGNANADFKNSQVVSVGSAQGDGQSILAVVLSLKNSDGSSVTGFRPLYNLISTNGTTVSGTCLLSDSSGKSTCPVTSTTAGVKSLEIISPSVGLKANLTFTVPVGKQNSLITSGSQVHATTTDGYTVTVSAGNPLQKFNARTTDGYKIILNPEGNE